MSYKKMINYVNTHRKELLIRFALSILAVVFVIFFSYSTSPLYPHYYGGDSAQFLTIGKAWSLGKLPYKEMFDHKGPIIFFIDMLGFVFTGEKSGVAILQSFFLIATVNAFFNLGKLRSGSNLFGAVVSLLCLIALKLNYGDGNYVEEYCMPFISFSVYFQMKFFYQKQEEHSPYAAAFYGLSFGVCALTRITNAIVVCAGVFVILVILLIKKRFQNVLQNACGFLIGLAAISLPFCIYFALNGCFYDFIYGTFLYNFEYQQGMYPWLKYAYSDIVTAFVFGYFCYYCILAAIVLALRRKAYGLAAFYTLSFALETYLFFGCLLFEQYSEICLVQIALLLNEIYLLRTEHASEGILKFLLLQFVMMICCSAITNQKQMPGFIDMYHTYHHREGTLGNSYEYLLAQIPAEELDSFQAYGDNPFKELYLAYDLMPVYKYFVIQEWHSSFSDFVREDIHSTFMNGNAKWILTDGGVGTIADVLEQRYVVHDTIDNYVLYRLR